MTSPSAEHEDADSIELTVIVPALNEQSVIADTLRSIRDALHAVKHEIIVVDNGSVDDTVAIARETADEVLAAPGAHIGELRNRGAEIARGRVLVFNDADVLLTSQWANAYRALAKEILAARLIVGGSLEVSEPANGIHRYWFGPLLSKKEGLCNYVGTGNLLVSKRLFDALGGFNALLKTGEDYDFCARARASGAEIKYVSGLAAVHLGYPLTVGQFFRREHWHGKGDMQSVPALLASKSALFSSLIAVLAALIVISALLLRWQWTISLFAAMAMLVVLMSYHKAPRVGNAWGRGYHIFLTLTYCLARATSGFG
jgi:cellulose synthase/poly-beta-1,6-N-acetylglucosamine synthase-like glycosyltransferase